VVTGVGASSDLCGPLLRAGNSIVTEVTPKFM
jgi:hypothetical protein